MMVAIPTNIEELQTADKYYAKILHIMDCSVKQVLYKAAQIINASN